MSSAMIPTDESRQLQAIAGLPQDLMLLKMENESIMAVAKAKPRDPMAIVGQLQQLIDAYPAAADEAIYSKPVGTVIECVCADCGIKYEVPKVDNDTACSACESKRIRSQRKVKKFAEGLSIRAAESIRSIYGYTRLATTTEMLPDGKARITGVLVDYAAGNMTSDERIVSPFYRARNGQMQRVAEDRFLNLTVKAEKAKLRRDVILDSVPNIVKAMFRDACEQKLADLVAPEVIAQKIIPAFVEFGITPEQLDLIIGKPRALGWKEEDRLQCRKILSALKNDETNARELLDGLVDTDPQTAMAVKRNGKQASNGATVEDLVKSPASSTPGTQETVPGASTTAPASGSSPPASEPAGQAHSPAEPEVDRSPEYAQDQPTSGGPTIADELDDAIKTASTPQELEQVRQWIEQSHEKEQVNLLKKNQLMAKWGKRFQEMHKKPRK